MNGMFINVIDLLNVFRFSKALLALAFELALNIDIARNYYLDYNNRRSDGFLPNYDSSNWRYILGLPPDFMLPESDPLTIGTK